MIAVYGGLKMSIDKIKLDLDITEAKKKMNELLEMAKQINK